MSMKLNDVWGLVWGFWACLFVGGGAFMSSEAWAASISTPSSDGRLFTVEGSNTVGAQLMKNLLLGYLEAKGAQQLEVRSLPVDNEYRVSALWEGRPVYVDVAAHGSSTGFRALQNNTADIAMSSRRVSDAEVERLKTMGDMRDYASEFVIAIDGLAVVVHPRNPIQVLNMASLGDIFSGRIRNWSQLGGPDAPISLYARDENSGTWDTFQSLVLASRPLAADAQRFESNDVLSDRVASDPHGIGVVGLGSVREAKVVAVQDEGTEPMRPMVLQVATEDYPLARRLFLYSPPTRQGGRVKDFLAYVQSDAGQEIVRASGFVSQNLVSLRHDDIVEGPDEYLALAAGAERLSVNLRFAEGSAELDNKARRDMQRIADYLQRAENSGKRLVLVGFGDDIQNQQRAEVLSRLRATAVKSALFRLGVPTEPVLGLGANIPVAKNHGEGRSKNRRVEVWVRSPQR